MSAEKNHLAERAARAEKIIAAPHEYKICGGCDSIVKLRAPACPNCHGYRFDASSRAVIDHARILASRPQRSVTAADLL